MGDDVSIQLTKQAVVNANREFPCEWKGEELRILPGVGTWLGKYAPVITAAIQRYRGLESYNQELADKAVGVMNTFQRTGNADGKDVHCYVKPILEDCERNLG